MTDAPKTRPSGATRAEEARDAQVRPGADATASSAPMPDDGARADESVAENYEEMLERGAAQKGEGRVP